MRHIHLNANKHRLASDSFLMQFFTPYHNYYCNIASHHPTCLYEQRAIIKPKRYRLSIVLTPFFCLNADVSNFVCKKVVFLS